MGRRLGLIIGVNTYQDTAFRPLQFAETDARALAQWLVHARGGNWGAADVQVVLGAQASRELVENLVTQLCLRMAAPDDLILIYFAGYAFVDQVSGEGYLTCTNTRYQQSGSGISLTALVNQIMGRSPAAQILCILDCYQFGSVWSMRRGSPFDYKPLLGPTLQNALQQRQGRLLYCSCRGNEMAPETGTKNLGSFMYRMIMGVSGPALEAATNQVTLQRLHAFLFEKLDTQHQPQIFGQEPRPLVLIGEMPSFQSKPGPGAWTNGPLPSADPYNAPPRGALPPHAPLAAPVMAGVGNPVAQLSPSGPGVGQATLETLEQNRRQQCQQMVNQARQLVQMQDIQQAYQILEVVLQMDPACVDALILRAQLLGSEGQFQEALDTAKQVVEVAPDNALGWSMAAALLANTGQLSDAMSAVDRSLSLDPSNSETIVIKTMIREKLAERDASTGKRSRLLSPLPQKSSGTGTSFALAAGIQLGALLLGIAGAGLPLLVPAAPKIISFLVESVALALLLVNSWRGPFLYGARRFPLTLVSSLLALALLMSLTSGLVSAHLAVKPIYNPLINHISRSFALLTPLFVLLFWLAAATLLPLLVGLIGLIAGAFTRARNAPQ